MDYTSRRGFLKGADDPWMREWHFADNPQQIPSVPRAYFLGKTLGRPSFKTGRIRFHNYSTSICGLLNHSLFVSTG